MRRMLSDDKPRTLYGQCAYDSREVSGVPIRLYQTGPDFAVQYGRQLDHGLDYAEAAAKLGQAMMHALACEGRIDDE